MPSVTSLLHGYFSGYWRKNPLLFGISDTVEEGITNLALAAGTNNLDGTAVPANRIYVITNLAIRFDGAAGAIISANIMRSAVQYQVFNVVAITAGLFYDRQTYIPMFEGDFVRMIVTGAALNDDAYLRYLGFAINLDD